MPLAQVRHNFKLNSEVKSMVTCAKGIIMQIIYLTNANKASAGTARHPPVQGVEIWTSEYEKC